MPGPVGGKRKHPDRSYSGEDYSRPSPHRPEELDLARNSQSPSNARQSSYNDGRNRGGRRGGRGGRGGYAPSNRPPPSSESTPVPSTSSPAPVEAPIDATMPNAPMEMIPGPDEQPLTNTFYQYAFLTDDICNDWEEKQQDLATQLIAGIQGEDDTQTPIILQELVHASLSDRIDATAAGVFVKNIISQVDGDEEDNNTIDIRSDVVDAVSVLSEDNIDIPAARLALFVIATGIDHDYLRHQLDPKLLEKLELIRSTFDRMSIRKQTNTVYRQANFNLMREESEGFAKLVTEVFSSCTVHDPSGDSVVETVEKVKALIGAFDLDVGRSLDVILDVFGSVLVKSNRFLVKFLRSSPWWPRSVTSNASSTRATGIPLWALPTFEGYQLSEDEKTALAQANHTRDMKFWEAARNNGLRAFYTLGAASEPGSLSASDYSGDEAARAWIEQTGMKPPTGNKDAAQLLGFKLRFYSSLTVRDESDVLPDNLMCLSALLIKIGFISLKDLYPHLWRPDEDMDTFKAQKQKEKNEREQAARPGAGVRNALANAGALSDDTLPSAVPSRLKESTTRAGTPSRDSEADKNSIKDANSEPADQKIALLKALLAIGALPEALFIIGRFPWVLELIPDLPEYIFRILHHSIKLVAKEAQPLADRPSLQEPLPLYDTDIPGVPKGQVKLSENPERKTLRWAQLDKADSPDGNSYRYHWDEWSDLIPVCQTIDDVFTLFDTLLPLVGVKIGQDPELVCAFARIGKFSLRKDDTEANRTRWLDFCKRILLPSVSLTKANAGVVNEVFELLTFFPTKTRYLLYLEWRDGRTSRNPDVKAAAEQAKAETKDLLKRISKTNARQMARQLAKIAYANPHIVTTVALNQIESYDSISIVFVEGSRYFTDLGYDVLTWNLIGSMAKAGRNKTQTGGIFASKWLMALSRFAGDIYKKYSMMKPGPILQYVASQLEQGNTMDLKMLESIVTSMGGITNDTSYNESQLQAMSGGPLLQSQTILQLLDQRHEKQATAKRLMGSLHTTGLVGKFLVYMAQQRQACIYQESDTPLKVIGNTYDEIHRILVQYLDLLQHNLGLEAFAEAVPDIVALLVNYQIRPEIAFLICRSVLSKRILEHEREKNDEAASIAPEASTDVDMKDEGETSEEDGEAEEDEVAETDAGTPNEHEILNATTDTNTDVALAMNGDERPWNPVLENVMHHLQDHLPEEVVATVGTGFYVTFWQLSLYEITVPRKSYQDEMTRQKKKRDALKADRSHLSASGTRKKEEQIQQLNKLIDDLLAENGQHVKAQLACRRRLTSEKMAWFAGQAQTNEKLNAMLMEHCFLPRLLTSPVDAYFTFAFIKYLHALGTPNFRTLALYDLLFRLERLTSLIFLCSAKEAEHLGRFLGELLRDLQRWHKTKSVFEKEAWGNKRELPGFATKVEAGKPTTMLGYDSFRKILYKWHVYLHQALQKCLKSSEYMHVRNAISVLHTISETGAFPAVNIHGVNLQSTIDKLRSSEMQDLVIASTSLLSALKRSEKLWVSSPVFCPGAQKEATPVPPSEQKTVSATVNNESKLKVEYRDGKDTPMVDIPVKPVTREENKAAAKTDDDSKLPPRPVNGSSTPKAQHERDSSRPARPDPSRASLPRKLSPPPRSTPPANLPTRPDQMDSRNGHREPSRTARPPPETVRPSQPRDSRDVRGVYSTADGDYERLPRRYDRPDPAPPSGRDERGYPREREPTRHHDRPRESYRDRERLSERDRPPSRPHSRDRDPRDRPVRGSSGRHAAEETTSRPPSTAPVRPSAAQPESTGVNPERARLLGLDTSNNGRGPPSRSDRPSREQSPRREDGRRGPPRPDRDERHGGDRHGDTSRHATPAGPGSRQDYGPRQPRDSRGTYGNAPVDMDAGRLEREPGQRGPSRREPAEADIPSGPRSHGMPAPRGRGGPAPTTQTSQPPQSERPAPTGPSGRHSRVASGAESNPPTGEAGGVHPSRLNQIASPVEGTRPPLPTPAGPRDGPRGRGAPVNAPSGPSPSTRGPPAGPAASEGMGRGGRPGRSQMNTLNDTLQQAAAPSGRGGRGGRQNSASYPPHSGPPSATDRGPSRQDNYGVQGELFPSHENPNDTPIGSRPPSTRHDNTRDRRPPGNEREDDRRPTRRYEESGRDPRSDRDGPPRRDERPSRRDEPHPSGPYGDDRSRGGYRGGPGPTGPRDDGAASMGRKHPRDNEGGPGQGQYPGVGGQGIGGGGGRGGRLASDSKRPRRGP